MFGKKWQQDPLELLQFRFIKNEEMRVIIMYKTRRWGLVNKVERLKFLEPILRKNRRSRR